MTRNYVTLGLATIYDKWEFDLEGGVRGNDNRLANTDIWDQQENASLTYEVIPKLRLGGGFNHTDIDNVGSNTLGLIAMYEFGM